MRFRRLLSLLMPGIVPVLLDRMRPVERSYFGPKWPVAVPPVDDTPIAEVLRQNWPILKAKIEGTDVLDALPHSAGSSELTAHNMLFTFLYVLARAAHRRDTLSVLDWGGALGHYGLVARRLLPEVAFDYVLKELPAACHAARALNPAITVVSSDEECFARSYDVVMASGAMHYAEDWRAMLDRLAGAAQSWLLINAQPIVRTVPSYVVSQQLRNLDYRGPLYSHVINRDELLGHLAQSDFTLERELMTWGPVIYKGAPEAPTGGGFLFRRR